MKNKGLLEQISDSNRHFCAWAGKGGAIQMEIALREATRKYCNLPPLTENEINEIKDRLSKEFKPGMYEISTDPLTPIKYLG